MKLKGREGDHRIPREETGRCELRLSLPWQKEGCTGMTRREKERQNRFKREGGRKMDVVMEIVASTFLQFIFSRSHIHIAGAAVLPILT